MNERPYEKLVAWRESHSLCLLIYRLTNSFPKPERYALVSQMQRASYSIPMNIAEGNAKDRSRKNVDILKYLLDLLMSFITNVDWPKIWDIYKRRMLKKLVKVFRK